MSETSEGKPREHKLVQYAEMQAGALAKVLVPSVLVRRGEGFGVEHTHHLR